MTPPTVPEAGPQPVEESRAFHGQAAAIIKVALAAMGYSDAQADARLSAFLSEQSDRTPPSSPRAGRSTVSAAGEPRDRLEQRIGRLLHEGYEIRFWRDGGDGSFGVVSAQEFAELLAASPAGPEAVPQSEREGLVNRDLLAEAIFESGVRQTMSQSEMAADNILAEMSILLARLASPAHPDEELGP